PRRSPPLPYTTLFRSGLDAEAVVEAVGEVGHAGDEGQLDDLILGEVALELAHRHVAQPRPRRPGHPLRIEQHRLVLLVEVGASLDRKSTRLNSSHEWI